MSTVAVQSIEGYVIVSTRQRGFILSEEEAEDLFLALRRDAIRKIVTDEVARHPEAFNFSDGTSIPEFVDYVMQCYDTTITPAENEGIRNNVYACAEMIGIRV